MEFKKRKGTGGISGQLYEIELTMALLLQGILKHQQGTLKNFHLATNLEEAGDFDDVIFKWESQEDITKIVFVQAKHKDNPENPKERVTIEKLLSDAAKKESFSLKDYFRSFLKIRETFLENSNDNDPIFMHSFENCEFIIFTNASPHRNLENSCIKTELDKESFFNFKQISSCSYQVINSDKLTRLLQDGSDCRKLAKELIRNLFPIENAQVFNLGVVKEYNIVLSRKMFEIQSFRSGVIKADFLENDDEDSTFKTEFYRQILEQNDFVGLTLKEIKLILRKMVIKLPDNFGKGESCKHSLPNDQVSLQIIEEFLSKLRIYTAQPNDRELSVFIKNVIQKQFKVELDELNKVYSDVELKVRKWWKDSNQFLTETNAFFQESCKVSVQFQTRKPLKNFTGRKYEMEQLKKMLENASSGSSIQSRMVVISGLGGVGKTELARKFFQESSNIFDGNVIWINAESERTLIESYNRLAKDKLGINTLDSNENERGLNVIIAEVYRFFSRRKSIFILDNLPKYTQYVSQFLPVQSLSQNMPIFVITSRYKEWENQVQVLNLGEFSIEDGLEFIQSSLEETNEAVDLLEKLQRFPLALHQAIAYIQDQKITRDYNIEVYLKEYELKSKCFLDSSVFQETLTDYSMTTFTTWKISVENIRKLSETAYKILQVISFLHPENIQRNLFLNLVKSEEHLRSSIRLLAKNSLINCGEKQEKFSIHRLVQEVTRLELQEMDLHDEILKETLFLLQENLQPHYLDHAVSAWNHATKCRDLIENFSNFPCVILETLENNSRRNEACVFGENVPEILQENLGDNHVKTLEFKSKLGSILEHQGHYQEALKHTQDVYLKLLTKLGSNHSEVLEIMNKLGIILFRLGMYDESLRFYKKILDNPNTTKELISIVAHNAMGVYVSQGKYQEAQEMSEKVLSFKSPINTRGDTLKSQLGKGILLFQQGKHQEAADVTLQILNTNLNLFPDNKKDILQIKNLLGSIYHAQGKFEEALEIFQEILPLLEEIDPITAVKTTGNLSTVLSSLERYQEALSYRKTSLEKQKVLLGENHPDYLSSRGALAKIFFELNQTDEAININKNTLEKQLILLGPNHPDVLNSMHNLALMMKCQGKLQEAINLSKETVLKRQEVFGMENIKTFNAMLNLGKCFLANGKFDEAVDCFQKVTEGRTKILGKNHQETVEVKLLLARTLAGINKLDQALELIDPNDVESKEKVLEMVPQSDLHQANIQDLTDYLKGGSQYVDTVFHYLPCNDDNKAVEFCKIFLQFGAKIDQTDCHGNTPLHKACTNSMINLADFLMSNGCNVNYANSNGLTPLHLAVENANFKLIENLVRAGAFVDQPDNTGYTPLLHSIRKGVTEEIFFYLTDLGADLNVKIQDGCNALHLAVYGKNLKLIKYLLETKNFNPDIQTFEGLTALHFAALTDSAEIIEILVENKANINLGNRKKITPLHFASYHGCFQAVQAMEKLGANLQCLDRSGLTPFDLAVKNDHLQTADFLSVKTHPHGSSLMHLATSAGNKRYIFELIKVGLNVNCVNQLNFTPMDLALANNNLEIAEIFLEYGGDISDDIIGKIADRIQKPTLEWLLNLGLSLEEKYEGCTPLVWALADEERMKIFLENGASVVAKTYHDSVLHRAVSRSSQKMLEKVLQIITTKYENSADFINYKDLDGDTPLIWAVEKGYVEKVKLLLKFSSDVNIQNDLGETALHWAVRMENMAIVEVLLNEGIDVGLKNLEKETALDLGQKLLKEKGEGDWDQLMEIVAVLMSVA